MEEETDMQQPKYAVNKISNNMEVKEYYQQTLDQNLTRNIPDNPTLQGKWGLITKPMKYVAEDSVGLQEKIKYNNWTPDAEISYLSSKQKNLRRQIECCSSGKKIKAFRQSRNRVLHQISSNVQLLRNT